MTCKDCIHERVCEKLCPKGLLPYQNSEYPAEIFCLEFKNKADFVEVVRCNQCRYCNPIICSSAYGCAHPDGLEHIKDRYKNYCSYGERRTEE